MRLERCITRITEMTLHEKLTFYQKRCQQLIAIWRKCMATDAIPAWLENAGQTLAFWIGYQHQRCRQYHLPEAAIGTELTALINAEIPYSLIVHRELLYRNIANRGKWMREIRADVVVTGNSESYATEPITVIEIKKADNLDEIHMDLVRLSYFKTDNPSARTFLLIASQNHRPNDWVLHNGEAERGNQAITVIDKKKEISVSFAVRRSIKAASSFRRRELAHYCVIIEVL